jgi:hypothetical protein
MVAFNCVGLVARVASDQVRESLLTVEQLLLFKGVEIVVEQVSADRCWRGRKYLERR